MNRDETVELFLKGREAWNAWAEGLLAERKALEAAGTWKSRRRNCPWRREKGENPETQAWLDKAFADFSRCLFLVQGRRGPRRRRKKEQKKARTAARLSNQFSLRLSRIDFERLPLSKRRLVRKCHFHRLHRFYTLPLPVTPAFDGVAFTRYARFERAAFTGDVWFY